MGSPCELRTRNYRQTQWIFDPDPMGPLPDPTNSKTDVFIPQTDLSVGVLTDWCKGGWWWSAESEERLPPFNLPVKTNRNAMPLSNTQCVSTLLADKYQQFNVFKHFQVILKLSQRTGRAMKKPLHRMPKIMTLQETVKGKMKLKS